MRAYTPFMYDLSKCINAFYCHVQLIRTNKFFFKFSTYQQINRKLSLSFVLIFESALIIFVESIRNILLGTVVPVYNPGSLGD